MTNRDNEQLDKMKAHMEAEKNKITDYQKEIEAMQRAIQKELAKRKTSRT